MSTSPELERFIEARQRRLVRLYQDAYAELVSRLARQKFYGLSTEFTGNLLRDVERTLTRLDGEMVTWIQDTFPDVYRDSSDQTLVDLSRRYHMAGLSGSFAQVHQDAVRRLMADTFRDIAAATQNVRAELKRAIRDAAKGIFRLGEVTGETRVQMTKRLVSRLAARGFTAEYDAKGKYIRLAEYSDRLSYERYAELMMENHWVGFVDAAGRRWDLLNYSEMLTRTKIREAVSRGTEDRLRANGLDLVQIVGPTIVVDWCGEYRGKVFSINGNSTEFPPLASIPNGGCPMHPRCVLGGTFVTGPRPVMSFSRWHEGEIVVIRTASGNELSVTPNHPVLTPEGWVASGLLNERDQVIRYLGQQGMVDAADPDYVDIPTRIEEITCSLGHSGSVFARSVPVAAEDFHGDGVGSNVCIVRADGLLGNDRDSTISKPSGQDSFCLAGVATSTLHAEGAARKLFNRVLLAADRIMSGGSQSQSSFRRKACQSEPGRFGHVGGLLNAEFGQAPLNGGVMDTKRTGDVALGFPGLVAVKDLLAIKGQRFVGMRRLGSAQGDTQLDKSSLEGGGTDTHTLSQGLQPFAGQIAFDTIIQVERRAFSGHVYNLQTKYSWYACNSIITHNCKDVEAPFVAKFHEVEELTAAQMPADSRWLGKNKANGHADQSVLNKMYRAVKT